MMLKSHFGITEPIQYKGDRNKTNKDWLPNNTHHTVKTFIESVSKDPRKHSEQREPTDTKQSNEGRNSLFKSPEEKRRYNYHKSR